MGYFDTIPKSLDEAAIIDGATRAQILVKMIIPLSKPIIIYTALVAFMAPWCDYIFASYVAVGEGDAASNVLTDLEAGADIFNFAQDQLARLVAAGALIELSDENAAIVAEENDAGSVAAATMGDLV